MIGVSSFVILVPMGEQSTQVLVWDEKQLKVVLRVDMEEPVH